MAREYRLSSQEVDRVWALALRKLDQRNSSVQSAFEEALVQYIDFRKKLEENLFSVPVGWVKGSYFAKIEDDGSILISAKSTPGA